MVMVMSMPTATTSTRRVRLATATRTPTRTVSGMLARVLVDTNQQATSRKELVGRTGVVISSRVNHEFGEVRIADKTGHVVRVICHTRAGDAPIAEGAEVVVVEIDESHG